jgi:hypothetical protein
MGDDNHAYNTQERKSFLGVAGRDFVPFKKTTLIWLDEYLRDRVKIIKFI